MFTSFANWFKSLRKSQRKPKARHRLTVDHRVRLQLECLEEREVPAAVLYDLTTVPFSTTLNGAIIDHVPGLTHSNKDNFLSIKLQGNDTGAEQGYNTGGTTQFNTFQASALSLASIPTVTINGTVYREFLMDGAESQGGNNELLSINEIRIFQSTTGNQSGYSAPATPGGVATLGTATQIYNMDAGADDNTVLINTQGGNGKLDLVILVPSALFTQSFVYVYAKMGDLNYPGAVSGATASAGAENFSFSNTGTITPLADLGVTKVNLSPPPVAGNTITYQLAVTNNGTATVTSLQLVDTLPPAVTNPVYTPSTGTYNPGTNVWSNLSLATGQTITLTVSGTIDPAATGTLANTVTVTPINAIDPNTSNNTATITETITKSGDLRITKTDNIDTVIRGQAITYTIVVSNPGPSTAIGAVVQDGIPGASFVIGNWTVASTNGASSTQVNHNTSINDTVTLPPNSTLTYTINGTVSNSAPFGTFTNTATVTPPGGYTDPNLLNNSASHTNTVVSPIPQSDLAITKSNGVSSVVPGTTTTYTIVVRNFGPSAVTGAQVADTFPTSLTGVTYTTAGTGGASGFSNGVGAINQTVNMPSGSTITYSVTGTVAPTATGTLLNIATVTAPTGVEDPNTLNNTAFDIDLLTPRADLAVAKVLTTSPVLAGGPASYTITVTNNGPSTVGSLTLNDTVPAAVVNSVFSVSNGSYDSVTKVWTFLTPLATGQSATMTLTGTFDGTARGSVTNTVTVSPPSGVTDPILTNNSASTTNTLVAQADLSVTKTDGIATVVAGANNTYTITVSNAGPATVRQVNLTDTIAANFLNPVFTPSVGTYDPGTNFWNGLELATGMSATMTLTGTVSPTASGTTTNTVTVTALDATETGPGPNTASDTDTIIRQGDLSITKTDTADIVLRGQNLVYTIVVSNPVGGSTATGAIVQDNIPAPFVLSNWSVVATNGAVSTQANHNVAINDTVTLPPGSSLIYTLNGTISSVAPFAPFTNTSTVTAPGGYIDPNLLNNSASHTNTVVPSATQADLSITKSNGGTTVTPGTTTTYFITVRNNSTTVTVPGATVVDNFPGILTGITYTTTATGGATGFTVSGAGSINDAVTMPPGSAITYRVNATVSPTATGQLANLATATSPVGIDDPNLANNAAIDIDTITPRADLSISKVLSSTTRPVPGGSITYTIVVRNGGPSTVGSVTLVDTLPSGLLNPVFSTTNGSYNSSTNLWNFATPLATGQTATLLLTGTVSASAIGTLTNTVTVSPPTGVTDPNLANNTATANNILYIPTDLGVRKTVNTTTATRGSTVTYTITVSNNGPGTVAEFRLVDTSSAFLINPTYRTSSGTFNPSTGIWSGLDLARGQSVTLTITKQISTAATGTLSDIATISLTSASGASFDSNSANNQDSASVNVLLPSAPSKRYFLTSYRAV